MVQRKFQEAFKAILWQDNDYPDVKEAKRKYFEGEEGGSVFNILKILPKNYNLERSLLEGMRKLGKDGGKNYLSAIAAIPRNMRNLYPHAYQSFLWNTVASLRLKNYGRELVVGDLVLSKNRNSDKIMSESKVAPAEEVAEDFERLQDSDFISVDQKILDSGEFTIADVYIPIFGAGFKFLDTEGENCVISHKIYKDLTEAEGIEVSDLKRLETNFMVQGGWRRMIAQAENLEWRFVDHDTKDVDLVTMYSTISEVKDVVLDPSTDEN